ncbi:MAG: hypothetical protein ACC652_06180 [Acidimicrobiales bacterium]
MAAPDFVPQTATNNAQAYSSPEHQPEVWVPVRPGEVGTAQPSGGDYGFQGPDQGFALKVAHALRPEVRLAEGENLADVEYGAVLLATRRASLFGRGPTVHDLRIGYCVFGFLDAEPDRELVALRDKVFEGLGNAHHYFERREMLAMVPDDVLLKTHEEVKEAHDADWRSLVSVST